ncbi:Calx-beta domain-containing protein [Stella humosa]|uniref:Calx-beta domain-containing protein n=1 Tax=Stella humosa TaxID=94 RepID=A0A3N1KSE6_9PROT|nr:M10 family metallopeptidase C-terminal domain-containing protein [Stella humosa]ROP81036.1 Calx-beta domain-containing protein [Stella humosa]BBK29726.1 hypothetical protein STHU_03600 [Stella humosa]
MARIVAGEAGRGGADQGCGCGACQAASGAGEAGGQAAGPYTSGDPGDSGNAAAILSAGGGWSTRNLTFSFASAVPGYYRSGASERNGFTELTPVQKAGVVAALAQIEKVTGLRFTEDTVPGDGPGDLVFGGAKLPDGVGAWGYLPQESRIGGDVWLSTAFANNKVPQPGSVAFARLLHEIGHALGLKHSGDYDSTGKDAAGPFLPEAQDNRQFTMMAYDPHPAYADTRPSTLLAFDIAALQSLYGANPTTGLGDTVYEWAPDRAVIAAIWDAGGQDRLDASNHDRAVTLDLRPGQFSSVGATDAGAPGRDNIAIAFGTRIEDATGGRGGDRIVGNDLANRLDGGGGDDTIAGGLGDDTILGGAGQDLARFAGQRSQYELGWDDEWLVVAGPDGRDRLLAVERLAFDDQEIEVPVAPVVGAPAPAPAALLPSPGLSADDVMLVEGHAGQRIATVTVRLDHASDGPVTVDWLTWGLTARKGQDYVGDEGTLVFAAGQTEAAIAVRIIGDRVREAEEALEIRFQNAVGAAIADDRARITIRDDDGPLVGLLGDRGDDAMPAAYADPWLF